MRAFVSYRHTGAEAQAVRELLETTRDALAEAGVQIHNTFFDVRKADHGPSLGPAEFMREAFEMMDRSDLLLVLQCGEERSEGMLMEVGYALAKGQPVVVATREGVRDTYLPSMATRTFEWKNLPELAEQLRIMDFESLGSEQTAAR